MTCVPFDKLQELGNDEVNIFVDRSSSEIKLSKPCVDIVKPHLCDPWRRVQRLDMSFSKRKNPTQGGVVLIDDKSVFSIVFWKLHGESEEVDLFSYKKTCSLYTQKNHHKMVCT